MSMYVFFYWYPRMFALAEHFGPKTFSCPSLTIVVRYVVGSHRPARPDRIFGRNYETDLF